jgi:hypothetical protein
MTLVELMAKYGINGGKFRQFGTDRIWVEGESSETHACAQGCVYSVCGGHRTEMVKVVATIDHQGAVLRFQVTTTLSVRAY